MRRKITSKTTQHSVVNSRRKRTGSCKTAIGIAMTTEINIEVAPFHGVKL
jgi:hypothetical protein